MSLLTHYISRHKKNHTVPFPGIQPRLCFHFVIIANVNQTQNLILEKTFPKRLLFHFYSLHEIWLFIYSYVFAIKLKERKKERETDRQTKKKERQKEGRKKETVHLFIRFRSHYFDLFRPFQRRRTRCFFNTFLAP